MHSVTTSPTLLHLAQVLRWLKAESDEFGTGFYCNRDVIAECFRDGRACCLLEGTAVVAFGVYRVIKDESDILIFEVHPQHRGLGYGVALAKAMFSVISSHGARTVSVECIPPTSERFWRARGFADYVDALEHRGPNAGVRLRKVLT
ncbi:GNAT family N-acetyltransferase [uncultured Piscinibacter sp.]|uniref:GNAT family N-acetyltransferase n=1 Tax=uncultured Piscinibacter sp. TaxID=1131835 RepID=UPI00260CE6E5|nr:GNAT family N-acetyltransferase [uncultured Piscinibacter sp.]